MEQGSITKCVGDVAPVAAAAINGEREESRREALITMVQSTDFRNGDHFAVGRCLFNPATVVQWHRQGFRWYWREARRGVNHLEMPSTLVSVS
jgi:hypothetical protein